MISRPWQRQRLLYRHSDSINDLVSNPFPQMALQSCDAFLGHPAASNHKMEIEIEWRCGGHSVTKKFMTILKILVAKHKWWKNLYFNKQNIFNVKIYFFFAEKTKKILMMMFLFW